MPDPFVVPFGTGGNKPIRRTFMPLTSPDPLPVGHASPGGGHKLVSHTNDLGNFDLEHRKKLLCELGVK